MKNILILILLFYYIINTGCLAQNSNDSTLIDNIISDYNAGISLNVYQKKHLVYLLVIACDENDTIKTSTSYITTSADLGFQNCKYYKEVNDKIILIRFEGCDENHELIKNFGINKADSIVERKTAATVYPPDMLVAGVKPALIHIFKDLFILDTIWLRDADILPEKFLHLWQFDLEYINKLMEFDECK
jgi:hypothetical protein